mmetsp:Transcript_69308/g.224032  ORF Transcript_69308/g.224032 Transcript_69308/m.224032 type:complete len:261 (-) Transcript_69308:378-1160(-)
MGRRRRGRGSCQVGVGAVGLRLAQRQEQRRLRGDVGHGRPDRAERRRRRRRALLGGRPQGAGGGQRRRQRDLWVGRQVGAEGHQGPVQLVARDAGRRPHGQVQALEAALLLLRGRAVEGSQGAAPPPAPVQPADRAQQAAREGHLLAALGGGGPPCAARDRDAAAAELARPPGVGDALGPEEVGHQQDLGPRRDACVDQAGKVLGAQVALRRGLPVLVDEHKGLVQLALLAVRGGNGPSPASEVEDEVVTPPTSHANTLD